MSACQIAGRNYSPLPHIRRDSISFLLMLKKNSEDFVINDKLPKLGDLDTKPYHHIHRKRRVIILRR